MRCTFCATGKGGFARNLMPYEIIDQVSPSPSPPRLPSTLAHPHHAPPYHRLPDS